MHTSTPAFLEETQATDLKTGIKATFIWCPVSESKDAHGRCHVFNLRRGWTNTAESGENAHFMAHE